LYELNYPRHLSRREARRSEGFYPWESYCGYPTRPWLPRVFRVWFSYF